MFRPFKPSLIKVKEVENVISLPQDLTLKLTRWNFYIYLGTKFNNKNLLQVVSTINHDLNNNRYCVMVEFLRRHYGPNSQ